METFSPLQRIKRDFYSYRNGVTAELLRKAGSPFRFIFGLTLPQLTEIAVSNGKDLSLARTLWGNSSTRCSMLIAPLLVPENALEYDEARMWCSKIPATEVADVLCHKLLVKEPYAKQLIEDLMTGSEMEKYTGLRLIMNILKKTRIPEAKWETIAKCERRRSNATYENIKLAQQILDELDYLNE